jgi:Family of unknown function (DUF6477)
MPDLIQSISDLRRPKLLIRAAHFGLADYSRTRDLTRLTGLGTVPSPERAVTRLLAEETEADAMRRTGDATYSLRRHVELLVALIAEARLLPRPDAV